MATSLDWIRAHPDFLWWMGGISAFTFFGSLIAIPIVVRQIPTDYFFHPKPPTDSFSGRHPVLRYTVRGLKNLFGALLCLSGLAMMFLPGQAILTMVVGITFLDFPGKRRLERWTVSRPRVGRSINWIREKTGREPLRLPIIDATTGELIE